MKSKLSALLCSVTAIYTIWYMHYGKPWTNGGALSKIGLSHRILFAIWGILTFCALALGTALGYRAIGKQRLYIPLLAVSGIGMALTLIFPFDYEIMPDYYFHCAGSLIFSAVTGITIFLLFALDKQKLFAAVTAAILIADLICLLIFKETGLIEALPIFAGYIMLSAANIRRDKFEATRKAAHS